MPHYRDGTEAKLGDVIKGRGYNVKHDIIGVLTRITAGAASCNVTIACVSKLENYGRLMLPATIIDGKVQAIENAALEVGVTTEYGQADAFERIWPPITVPEIAPAGIAEPHI